MIDDWTPPPRPAELTEQRLIRAFLAHEFPSHSNLPGERELAQMLGVTRPTLREALQRLARDGWITIQQGKPTQVNDFWWEGNLNVLGSIVRYGDGQPEGFVANLLEVRLALAPAYTQSAVAVDPAAVAAFLQSYQNLADDAVAYAQADWALHIALIRASGNPIYMLIFNGFSSFYVAMAQRYFSRPETRRTSAAYYHRLLQAAEAQDAAAAATAARLAMEQSIVFWQESES